MKKYGDTGWGMGGKEKGPKRKPYLGERIRLTALPARGWSSLNFQGVRPSIRKTSRVLTATTWL